MAPIGNRSGLRSDGSINRPEAVSALNRAAAAPSLGFSRGFESGPVKRTMRSTLEPWPREEAGVSVVLCPACRPCAPWGGERPVKGRGRPPVELAAELGLRGLSDPLLVDDQLLPDGLIE
jgi:hypothetical protein